MGRVLRSVQRDSILPSPPFLRDHQPPAIPPKLLVGDQELDPRDRSIRRDVDRDLVRHPHRLQLAGPRPEPEVGDVASGIVGQVHGLSVLQLRHAEEGREAARLEARTTVRCVLRDGSLRPSSA